MKFKITFILLASFFSYACYAQSGYLTFDTQTNGPNHVICDGSKTAFMAIGTAANNTWLTSNGSVSRKWTTTSGNDTWYHAEIHFGNSGSATITCGSLQLTVTVNASTVVGGTAKFNGATPTYTMCSGSTSPSISLSGYTGVVRGWFKAPPGTASWTEIKNGTSSITSATLSSSYVSNTTPYQYRAKIGTACNGTESYSSSATMSINHVPPDPAIVPAVSNCGAKVLTLSVTSDPDDVTSHAWYTSPTQFNTVPGVEVINTNGTAYVTQLQKTFTSTTTYWVEAKNGCGSSTRLPITATINSAPAVSISTHNPTITYNGSVCSLEPDFTLRATSGSGYQWKKGGSIVPGATSRDYKPLNAGETSGGSYTVRINTSCGWRESSAFVFGINTAKTLAIDDISGSESFCRGSTKTYTVVLDDPTLEGLVNYEWRKNGTLITDNNSKTYASSAWNVGTNTLKCKVTLKSLSTCATPSSDEFTLSINVNTVADEPTTYDATSTCNQDVEIQAISQEDGVQHSWYTSATGGSPLTTYELPNCQDNYPCVVSDGSPYLTQVSATSSSDFWVAAINGCGASSRVKVSGTIEPLPIVGITYNGNPTNVCLMDTEFTLTATSGSGYQWNKGAGRTAISGATEQVFNPATDPNGGSGRYSVSVGTSCGVINSDFLDITIAEAAALSNTPANRTIWSGSNVSFTPTVSPAGSSYSWAATSDEGIDMPSTFGSTAINQAIENTGTTVGTATFTIVPFNSGCEGTSKQFTVTVHPNPVITLTGAVNGKIAQSDVTLDAGGDYSSYVWRNGAGGTIATTQIYTTSSPDTYSITVTKSGVTGSGVSSIELLKADAFNENYVIENTVMIEGIDAVNDVNNLVIGEKAQTIQYFDGLGRPKQVVNTQGSAGHLDIVQHMAYDNFGREANKYLPYVATSTTGEFVSTAATDQDNFYNPSMSIPEAANVAKDNDPFAATVFESSPLNRVLKQGAPGEDWQPDPDYATADHAVVFEYVTNTTDEVYNWEITPAGDCKLSSTTYYEENELFVTVTKDENWTSGNDGTIREYKDKLGRVVLKRTYDEDIAHDTYYVYDDFGNLRVVLPPEAIVQLIVELEGIEDDHVIASSQELTSTTGVYYYTPGVTVTLPAPVTYTTGFEIKPYPVYADAIKELIFIYEYDERQRMVEKKVPGAEPVYMVYDARDRLVLTQDGNQRKSNQWIFTKYDPLNRPVLTGLMSDGTNTTRESMQDAVNAFYNGSNPMFEERTTNWDGGDHGYSDLSFPKGIALTDYLTVTYYDDYSFIPPSYEADFGFNGSNDINNGPKLDLPKGQVTGGKVRVFDDNEFLKSVSYYDRKYNVIQSRSDHYLGDTQDSYMYYDFIGQLKRSKTVHHNGSASIDLVERFEYDHGGRLLKAWHKINELPEVLTTENTYNELGELIDKKLHFDEESAEYAQSVDYRYNIRGWLTNINNTSRSIEAGINDDSNDLFGMQLMYNSDDAGIGALPTYNGNISGMTWSNGSYNARQKAYKFDYDKLNRLTDASYKEKTATSWSVNLNHFNVTGISYDQNGNIETLNRYESNTLIDELIYSYIGNQLQAVNDQQNHVSGFKDGAESAEEYFYDANGNMTADRNKGIANIEYNLLNLPQTITFEDGNYIEYEYDAAGMKLGKKVYENNTLTSETKYVGGMIYEDGLLKLIQTAEGRIAVERIAGDNAYDYQYYLRDHLGNNRVVFKSEEVVYTATMEDELASEEQAQFKNIANTRQTNTFYNHTSPSATVPIPDRSARLNANIINGDGTRRVVGPGKALKVYPGDVIEAEVWARYQELSGDKITADMFLFSALMPAFGISAVGETGQAFSAFDDVLGATALMDQNPGDRPAAYLNYIFFDLNYQNSYFGSKQVGTGAATKHEIILMNDIPTITEEGYLYIYVSNESNLDVDVYFDDLKITHTSANMIVQANDYYPFGLTMKPSDFQRDGEMGNNFLYNGKELQTDLELDWYDYGARMYDAALGRWHVVDAMSEDYFSWTPYNYVGNNPLKHIDIHGLDWFQDAQTGAVLWVDNNDDTYTDEGGVEYTNIGQSYTYSIGDFSITFDQSEVSSISYNLGKTLTASKNEKKQCHECDNEMHASEKNTKLMNDTYFAASSIIGLKALNTSSKTLPVLANRLGYAAIIMNTAATDFDDPQQTVDWSINTPLSLAAMSYAAALPIATYVGVATTFKETTIELQENVSEGLKINRNQMLKGNYHYQKALQRQKELENKQNSDD